MGNLVYFSTTSENTHRFVLKLGMPALRIPGSAGESLLVDAPYVLLVPTYGGGSAKGAVPSPVIRFLNNIQNRQWLRGVIAAGNTNFGEAFCIAGDIIARKCGVPFLYRFELMGTPEDVETVRQGVETFWKTQP